MKRIYVINNSKSKFLIKCNIYFLYKGVDIFCFLIVSISFIKCDKKKIKKNWWFLFLRSL